MSDDSFDGRALLHGGLSAAMMASFSYHTEGVRFGTGQKIGIVFAAALAIMDAFFPNEAPVDPDPAATEKEVQKALNDMVKGVIDQEWWDKVNNIQNQVSTLATGFYNVWDDLKSNIQLQPDATLTVSNTSLGLAKYIDTKYEYFNPLDPAQLLMVLRKARYTLETSSLNDPSLTPLQVAQHQTLTIGLYALIGGLTGSYLKASIAWAWAREQQLSWRYAAYQKDLDAAQGDASKVQAVEAGYPDVNSSTGFQPLGWNDFVNTPGSAVSVLKSEVQAMLDYCITLPATDTDPAKDGLYSSMWDDLNDFDSKIASCDVIPANPAALTKAEMMLAVQKGATRSGLWEALEAQNARLKFVPEDDLELFQKNIEIWKAMAATVRFKVYAVATGGEYVDDLAQSFYGNSDFYLDLISANSDVLDYDTLFPPPPVLKGINPPPPPPAPRPGFINAGTLLRKFDLDALSYIAHPPSGV